jgi:hypothetical protein
MAAATPLASIRPARKKLPKRVRPVAPHSYLFVRYYETGGNTSWVSRPPGVDGSNSRKPGWYPEKTWKKRYSAKRMTPA